MITLVTDKGDVHQIDGFTFSDGQPHLKLPEIEAYAHVDLTCRLSSVRHLFDLMLVMDVLRHKHCFVSLNILYMLGARMDRRIDDNQPYTLGVICDFIRTQKFESIRILDPHSQKCLNELGATGVMPIKELMWALSEFDPHDTVIVAPDKGAATRTIDLVHACHEKGAPMFDIVQGDKVRDIQTGELTGFSVDRPDMVGDKRCLIVDDLCDGGGTFTGLGKVLYGHGANSNHLFVTHGIFSKGYQIGMSSIYTTDSFDGDTYVHRPFNNGVVVEFEKGVKIVTFQATMDQ